MNIRPIALLATALLAAGVLAGCSSMGFGTSGTSGTRGNTETTPHEGQGRDDVNAANLPAATLHLPAGESHSSASESHSPAGATHLPASVARIPAGSTT